MVKENCMQPPTKAAHAAQKPSDDRTRKDIGTKEAEKGSGVGCRKIRSRREKETWFKRREQQHAALLRIVTAPGCSTYSLTCPCPAEVHVLCLPEVRTTAFYLFIRVTAAASGRLANLKWFSHKLDLKNGFSSKHMTRALMPLSSGPAPSNEGGNLGTMPQWWTQNEGLNLK